MLGRPSRDYPSTMHLAGRDRDAWGEPTEVSTEDGPALRDASHAASRAAEDEAAATAARDSFRIAQIPEIDPDQAIRPHLAEGERVHALRRHAILRAPAGEGALGHGGTLYLTSHRLIHLGQVVVSVNVADIEESSLAGERLLLTLRGGGGMSLDLDRPRVLRAELAEIGRGLRR